MKRLKDQQTPTSRPVDRAATPDAAGGRHVLGAPLESSPAAYAHRLVDVLSRQEWSGVERLIGDLEEVWQKGAQVFLCGNGGSAANAVHLANDFLYPVAKDGHGLRVHALSANPAILTCLANDLDYESIFSRQIEVLGRAGDLLIVLTGSGNSPNVIRAIETARTMGVRSCGLLGFSGGRCLKLVDVPIHFVIDDMQIAEDLQLIVGHMVMKALQVRIASRGND